MPGLAQPLAQWKVLQQTDALPFDNRKVGAVTVTLVNASTRYQCGRGTLLACKGKPLDDKMRFAVKGRVTK